MYTIHVCICVIVIVILSLMTNRKDFFFEKQVFKILKQGLLPIQQKKKCSQSDQVYLPEFDSCLRTCSSGKEYDIYADKCNCPSSSTELPNGECSESCNPATKLFDPHLLRRKTIENTCMDVLERHETCPLDTPFWVHGHCAGDYMITKEDFTLDEFYYIDIGKGSKEDCLASPTCDGILGGENLFSLKPLNGKIEWTSDPGSETSFKIRV